MALGNGDRAGMVRLGRSIASKESNMCNDELENGEHKICEFTVTLIGDSPLIMARWNVIDIYSRCHNCGEFINRHEGWCPVCHKTNIDQ